MRLSRFSLALIIVLASLVRFHFQSLADEPIRAKFMKTPSGIRFSLLGEKMAKPSPTLLVFAKDMQSSLEREAFAKVTWLLARQGFLSVALDLPCHGADEKPGEPPRLGGWRSRVDAGDSLVPAFVSKVSAVLDFLIQSGYTDPNKIAACGTSRGGFMAFHFTAAEPRVKCVIAFAPVTDLMVLSEFSGTKNEKLARSLSVMNVAEKLADKGVWIYIGNRDMRVGTDDAIAFARAVTQSAVAKKGPANVRLVVVESEAGSDGHGVALIAHTEAAAWISTQFGIMP